MRGVNPCLVSSEVPSTSSATSPNGFHSTTFLHSFLINILVELFRNYIKNIMKEFITFIREKGVLGLAVGIIMGGAVTKLVTSIVENLLNPLIGAVTGAAGNLNEMAYTIPLTEITFKYGAFISSLIDFTAVLAVVYFVFVKSPINKIDKK